MLLESLVYGSSRKHDLSPSAIRGCDDERGVDDWGMGIAVLGRRRRVRWRKFGVDGEDFRRCTE